MKKSKGSSFSHSNVNEIKLNKHLILMIIGCSLPLLLIFMAPAMGINTGVSLMLFVFFMFLCHLLMPMHHKDHTNKDGRIEQNRVTKFKKQEHGIN